MRLYLRIDEDKDLYRLIDKSRVFSRSEPARIEGWLNLGFIGEYCGKPASVSVTLRPLEMESNGLEELPALLRAKADQVEKSLRALKEDLSEQSEELATAD